MIFCLICKRNKIEIFIFGGSTVCFADSGPRPTIKPDLLHRQTKIDPCFSIAVHIRKNILSKRSDSEGGKQNAHEIKNHLVSAFLSFVCVCIFRPVSDSGNVLSFSDDPSCVGAHLRSDRIRIFTSLARPIGRGRMALFSVLRQATSDG